MRIGFAKNDITPRVGVEMCGFGPFINRHSIGVRDRLWARAMALEVGDRRAVIISCDLVCIELSMTNQIRALVTAATDVPADGIMVHCIHTHSGPNTAPRITGWGQPDPPYIETLPQRVAAAAIAAIGALQEATLAHAEVPCEGVGLNREYDRDAPPLEEVLRPDWRPAKPELTDTTCHVLRADAGGRLLGFCSYFGCHPVVCCQLTRYLHGDYAGVATNLLEREHLGAVGLFLQGAQGDVNSCCVHKPEQESLLALDEIAGRYARAVRAGLAQAAPLAVADLRWARHAVAFSRKPWGLDKLRGLLAEKEALVHRPGLTDTTATADCNLRLEVVYLLALRKMVAQAERGEPLSPPSELHGLRFGPVVLLGSGFEIFQRIKNEVKAGARAPVPLVMGLTGDCLGYAPDREAAARGGYAADMVPLILGQLPYADAHGELVKALLALDQALA